MAHLPDNRSLLKGSAPSTRSPDAAFWWVDKTAGPNIFRLLTTPDEDGMGSNSLIWIHIDFEMESPTHAIQSP